MHHKLENPGPTAQLAVAVGDLLEICLPVIAGTGYTWSANPTDRLHLIGSSTRSADHRTDARVAIESALPDLPADSAVRSGVAGAAGTQHLMFAADAPGPGRLHLVLQRVWELEPLRTVSIDFVVQR